ncbi:MAG: hypothetical protein PHP65_04530 [Bacilli bacterium]|nr:hypothetical protein [Bacilli bacterium]
MKVITSFNCLKQTTAKYMVVEELDISSPLGKMQVIDIVSDGLVLVAGPSSIKDVDKMITYLKQFHLDKIFIDGAFSRHSSTAISDGFIYCVGAGYSTILSNIINKTALDLSRFSLPEVSPQILKLKLDKNISFITDENVVIKTEETSLLDFDFNQMIVPKNTAYLYLPNALTDQYAKRLLLHKREIFYHILLNHLSSLQIQDDTLKRMNRSNIKIYVKKQIPLLAICMNPFSPYRDSYGVEEMKQELQALTKVPVINVVEEGEQHE